MKRIYYNIDEKSSSHRIIHFIHKNISHLLDSPISLQNTQVASKVFFYQKLLLFPSLVYFNNILFIVLCLGNKSSQCILVTRGTYF